MKNRKDGTQKTGRGHLLWKMGEAWRMPAQTMVILRGGDGATVHGCRKILQYSPIEIRLLLERESVSIEGEGLYCTSFGTGCVTIKGCVHRATYAIEEQERQKKGTKAR